jgi:hypothetical protein
MTGEATDFRNVRYSQGLLKSEKVIARESEEGVFEALGLPCSALQKREVVAGKPVWLTGTT